MDEEDARTFFSKKKLKIDVCENVVERLKRRNILESRSPNFHENLCSHFDRMPASYAMMVKSDANLDVLRHKHLLDLARNPAKRPAIHVRDFKVHPADELTRQTLHEITCATTDSPEPFQFATALHSMDLTIKEMSMLSTTDGYCLLVFVVRSNTVQTGAQLSNALQKELLKANQRRAGPVQVYHDPENPQPTNRSERSRWLMFLILFWLLIDIVLGIWYPFIRTKSSTLMSKVAGMFTMLGSILAAVGGFYRKLGR